MLSKDEMVNEMTDSGNNNAAAQDVAGHSQGEMAEARSKTKAAKQKWLHKQCTASSALSTSVALRGSIGIALQTACQLAKHRAAN
jgi:hypothetical protein